MKFIFSFSIFILTILSSCGSRPDIASGLIGTWNCSKVTYEIVKPDWVSVNLGGRYQSVIDRHIEASVNSQFTFYIYENTSTQELENRISISGDRSVNTTWSVIDETRTIDVNFSEKGYEADYVNRETNQVETKKVRKAVTGYGWNYALYSGLSTMSWEVKEFDPKNKMLVTESLGDGSVVFTYYLEME